MSSGADLILLNVHPMQAMQQNKVLHFDSKLPPFPIQMK